MNEATKKLYGNIEGGYNGWRNYATWNIALWLSNDEGLYRLVRAKAPLRAYKGYKEARHAKRFVSKYMRTTPDGINMTHKGIDWDEIASAMREITGEA